MMRNTLLLLPWLAVLTSCGTPPRPPTVDPSAKRPVNNVAALELQACRHDLQNTRIAALEAERLAQSSAAMARQIDMTHRLLMTLQSKPERVASANTIFTIPFAFNSATVHLPSETQAALVAAAREASLVYLRGRTDGSSDAPAESRVARDRAEAVRTYLIAAGVPASHIRTTYQPAGDQVADNSTPVGRSFNRRVEVEMYQQPPTAWPGATGAGQP